MLRVLWGVLLLSVVATGVVAASDGPLADAGLDQTVDQYSTVYLDAGGSVAPDGEIASHEWDIQRPDGSTMEPACASCEQTSFVAEQTGEYAVTATVTDGSGTTASDTLYVTVRDVDPPSATLSGPTDVEKGDSVTYDIDGDAGDAELTAYELAVGGDRVERTTVDDGTQRELTVRFSETGERTVTGSVVDDRGLADEDTLTVQVTGAGCAGCVDAADIDFNTGSGSHDGGGPVGADATVYEGSGGEATVQIDSTITDLNPEGTTTLRMNGNQYKVDNEEYAELAHKDKEGGGVTKQGDVPASRVLVDGTADQLEQDARVEGNVETFDYNGNPERSQETTDGGDSDTHPIYDGAVDPGDSASDDVFGGGDGADDGINILDDDDGGGGDGSDGGVLSGIMGGGDDDDGILGGGDGGFNIPGGGDDGGTSLSDAIPF